jgi:UPF0716 protein FxsA
MRFSLIPVVVLLMPILEIAGFIVVGKAIGLWLTLALILLTSFIGLVILRSGGLGMVRNLQAASRTSAPPAKELVSGAMRVVAGILLFLPGFITDIIGLLLLVPAFRRLIWAYVGTRFVVSGSFRNASGPQDFRQGPQNPGASKVVDLDDDDFHRDGSETSPWRPGNDDRELPKP